jgi:hypothetical protein
MWYAYSQQLHVSITIVASHSNGHAGAFERALRNGHFAAPFMKTFSYTYNFCACRSLSIIIVRLTVSLVSIVLIGAVSFDYFVDARIMQQHIHELYAYTIQENSNTSVPTEDFNRLPGLQGCSYGINPKGIGSNDQDQSVIRSIIPSYACAIEPVQFRIE